MKTPRSRRPAPHLTAPPELPLPAAAGHVGASQSGPSYELSRASRAQDLRSVKAKGPGSLLGARSSALQITPQERAASAALNKKVAAQAPALGMILGDPKAFAADVKARFAAQKAKTPDAPYTFDFSDVGMPALADMAEHIDAEILKVQGQLQALEAKDKAWIPDFLTGHDGDVKEATLGLEYLVRLKQEVQRHLKKGAINYRQLQELGHFVSRALGHFDEADLNLRDRAMLAIDRHMQGYVDIPIEEQIEQYCARAFSVFQKPSPVGGFQAAHEPFEQAFFNKEEMKFVAVPTMEHLGPGPFMRLLPYDVYLLGISPEPEPADGFVRPGADFWLHDMRHASAIFDKHEDYAERHNLSDAQKEKINSLVDKWVVELNEERKQLPDKSLRYAIGFMSFNFHHDRGYRMVPSSFVNEAANDHVPRLLYEMLRVSEQPRGFDHPAETMQEAFDWLQNFWLARKDQEDAVLQAQ